MIIAMGIIVLYSPARMMKTHRTNYTLLALFFASLLVLWGLEYSGVRTNKERRLRESLILPELLDTPAIDIRKVSIERGKERLVFERRGAGSDALADGRALERRRRALSP